MAHVKLHPHIQTSPRLYQYVIALLSLLLTLAFYAVIFMGFELSTRSALRDHLSTLIRAGNTRQEVRQALDWVSNPSLLTSEFLGIDQNVSENKAYRDNLLLNALEQLHNGDVRKAFTTSSDQLSAELKELYREYFDVEKRLKKIRIETSKLNREIEISEKQFELIAEDVSDLFASKSLVKDENDSILRYQLGVMKDMPVIKGLPDNLRELEDLKPYIKLIVGAMNNDQILEFRSNFERLQAVSTQNASEIRRARAQIESSQQDSSSLKSRLTEVTTEIVARTAALITGR